MSPWNGKGVTRIHNIGNDSPSRCVTMWEMCCHICTKKMTFVCSRIICMHGFLVCCLFHVCGMLETSNDPDSGGNAYGQPLLPPPSSPCSMLFPVLCCCVSACFYTTDHPSHSLPLSHCLEYGRDIIMEPYEYFLF